MRIAHTALQIVFGLYLLPLLMEPSLDLDQLPVFNRLARLQTGRNHKTKADSELSALRILVVERGLPSNFLCGLVRACAGLCGLVRACAGLCGLVRGDVDD